MLRGGAGGGLDEVFKNDVIFFWRGATNTKYTKISPFTARKKNVGCYEIRAGVFKLLERGVWWGGGVGNIMGSLPSYEESAHWVPRPPPTVVGRGELQPNRLRGYFREGGGCKRGQTAESTAREKSQRHGGGGVGMM